MTELPYPAKRCGIYLVVCERCGYSAAITTAGRPDDPRKVTLPCKLN
jgi:C4-type Zn-finger protein